MGARHAFELLTPWDYVQPAGEAGENHLDIELNYGIAMNWHTGFRLPVAFGPGGETGVAGIGAFALFNPVREGVGVPALSLRGDFFSATGASAQAGLTAIATRSLGAARVHLNAGAATGEAASDALPRWHGGLALDYTFCRPSLLVVGALSASQPGGGDPTESEVSAGLRWQGTPTMVVEAGAGRRLSSAGPDLRLTLGVSSTLGFRRMVPIRPPSGPVEVRGRAEQFG